MSALLELKDVHTHIGNLEAARLFFKVADDFGVQRIWSSVSEPVSSRARASTRSSWLLQSRSNSLCGIGSIDTASSSRSRLSRPGRRSQAATRPPDAAAAGRSTP